MRVQSGNFEGAGGTSLFFQSWRPDRGDEKGVLGFIHGLGSHGGGARFLVEHLVGEGYVVYAYDLRGHGKSSGERAVLGQWVEFREDTDAFIQLIQRHETKAANGILLIAHSLGGLIALDYVMHHPEGITGLATINPAFLQQMLAETIKHIPAEAPNAFSIESPPDFDLLTRDPEVLASFMADPLRHQTKTVGLMRGMTEGTNWVIDHPQELKSPFLLMLSLADPIVPPDNFREFFERVTFPEKELLIYPDSLHNPHDDINREQVLADLSSWLERKRNG